MANKIFERDTGKDCPYCGGVIYAHVTKTPSEERTEYHNCKMCGANWSPDWSLTRLSNVRTTKKPRERFKANPVLTRRRVSASQVPSWMWMVIVIVAALLLVRLGIFALFGPLLMVMTIFILGYIVFRIGKEQRWW